VAEDQDKSCCTNPPEAKFDEASKKALVKFFIWLVLIVAIISAILFSIRNTDFGRHFFMSPEEMREHSQPQ
jgi:hypothetical protein